MIIQKETNIDRKCEICGKVFLPAKPEHLICLSCWKKQKSLIPEFIQAIDEEIQNLKFHNLNIQLLNGKLIQTKRGKGGTYLFGCETQKINPGLEDASINIQINSELYKGEIITIEETKIILYIENYFCETINEAVITIDKCFLYELLKDRLRSLSNSNEILEKYKLANLIFVGKGKKLPSEINAEIKEDFINRNEFNSSQQKAIEASQQLPLTLIWGPPGTGKTKTLAGVVKSFLNEDKNVLVTAHSNVAVDEATIKIAELLRETNYYQNGEILRIGNYQKIELTTDYPLTLPSEVLKKKAGHLLEKREILLQKYQRLKEYKRFVLGKERVIKKSKTKRTIKKELEEKKRFLEELKLKRKKEKLLQELTKILGDREEAFKRIEAREKVLPKEIEELEKKYKELELFELNFRKFDGLKLSFEEVLEWEREVADALEIIEKKIQFIKENILTNAKVICTTLTKTFSDKDFTEGPLDHFNVLVIDEASMAPLPYIFWALTRCENILVLIGDFLQLQPICSNENGKLSRKWLSKSIYNHLELDDVSKVKQDGKVFLLDTQYRMNPRISEISNSIFYERRLKDADEVMSFSPLNIPPFGESPLILIDTSRYSRCEKVRGGSRINKFHAQKIIDILKNISMYQFQRRLDLKIAVITPYFPQASLIRKKYKEQKLKLKNITISTIHRFQGGESDIVIFDTVEAPGLKTSYSMLNNENKEIINVAITRAKHKMFLIVNKDFIEEQFPENSLFRKLIYYFKKDGFLYKVGLVKSRKNYSKARREGEAPAC